MPEGFPVFSQHLLGFLSWSAVIEIEMLAARQISYVKRIRLAAPTRFPLNGLKAQKKARMMTMMTMMMMMMMMMMMKWLK